MWWMVWGLAMASMLEVPLEGSVRRGSLTQATDVTVQEGPTSKVVTFDGGWVTVSTASHQIDVWMHADWKTTWTAEGFEGDGADELALQVDLQTWIADHHMDSPAKVRNASRRVQRATKKGALSELAKARVHNASFAAIAHAAARQTPGRQLYEQADWFTVLQSDLPWDDEVVHVPGLWSFGWHYGRMCGGVRSQGAPKAVAQSLTRAHGPARHATVAGTVYWAIESAGTTAEIRALDEAMAVWKAADPPDHVFDVYARMAQDKKRMLPGNPAPSLTAMHLDGEEIALSSLYGKPMILDFWGTWCGPCVASIPDLKRLSTSLADRVTFVAIAKERAYPAWRDGVRQHRWTEGWHHLARIDGQASNAFSVVKYPSYVVLDADGVIVATVSSATEAEGIVRLMLGAGSE